MHTRGTISSGSRGLQYSESSCVCSAYTFAFSIVFGAEHIKVQIDPTKLLHKLPQYPLKPEAKKRLKPIFVGLISKDPLNSALALVTLLCYQ